MLSSIIYTLFCHLQCVAVRVFWPPNCNKPQFSWLHVILSCLSAWQTVKITGPISVFMGFRRL